MSKKLSELFNVQSIKDTKYLTDYEIFSDKDLLDQLRQLIIQKILDAKMDDDKELSNFINQEIDLALESYNLSNMERNYIFNMIDNEINGFGPITPLLENDVISEIMVNGINEIYIETDGKIHRDETISFINDDHILRTINRIVQPLGKNIDTRNPLVDARLKDGSRVNAVIPPLSRKGPVLTIRKFKQDVNEIEDIIRNGTLTPYMARFLEACVMAKCNIIISGGTSTGKTSMLNVLSSFIAENERVITIEDAAELNLNQEHVISLETRSDNVEGTGAITVRDLLINSLRMRPDRIIIGEVRGKEAFDLLQAMNTGHEGSLTTLHANSPSDALRRLETMVLMANMELPLRAIREYIANAIDIVVQVERLSDGRRRVVSICEVLDLSEAGVKTEEIFAFNQTGVDHKGEVEGEFVLYKYVPRVLQSMQIKGIDCVNDIFEIKKGK